MVAAGNPIYAAEMNAALLKCVARRIRSSNKAVTGIAAGTYTPIMRIDSVQLKAGQIYQVLCTGFRADSATDTDLMAVHIFYSTSGVATTSSTELARAEQSDQRTMYVAGLLPVAGDATYSFLLAGRRAIGAGSVNITYYCEPAALSVWAGGDDPGQTGTDL